MTSRVNSFLSSVALFAAALISLGLVQPARAAEADTRSDAAAITSPRDHASGLPTGKRSQIAADELEKWEGVLARVQALSAEAAALRSLTDELSALEEEEASAVAEEAEAAEEELAQIDAASAIFTDQVAGLLDPEVAKQVTEALARRRGDVKFNDISVTKYQDSASPSLQAVLDELEKLEELLGPLAAAAQQGKSTSGSEGGVNNTPMTRG